MPDIRKKIFREYSNYYDLLYQDKNYKGETQYIHNLMKKYATNAPKKILNIGCGTGNHDIYFSNLGYNVYGIDISEEMISIARSKSMGLKNIHYRKGDGKTTNLNQKFDAVLSLFHTICYQTTEKDLIQYIKNTYRHLKKNGLFIFDIWYGPAVLNDLPKTKTKSVKNNSLHIARETTPTLFVNNNTVNVNFNISIKDNKSHSKKNITENHLVRYFFLPELKYYLSLCGFKLLTTTEWMKTGKTPDINSWNICLVAQK